MKKGSVIETIYNEKAVLQNKEDLVSAIVALNIGETLDWWDLESEDEVGTAYTVEKMNWNDSLIVLIGGYGGEVLSECLDGYVIADDYSTIEGLVNTFFMGRFIEDDELIAIEKRE